MRTNLPRKYKNKSMFQTATASHNLGSAFAVGVEDAKDAFEKMVLSSYKETDMVTLYSDKVGPFDQLHLHNRTSRHIHNGRRLYFVISFLRMTRQLQLNFLETSKTSFPFA